MRLFLYIPDTVFTHNKHIFVRPKKVCLLWEKCFLWVGTVFIWLKFFLLNICPLLVLCKFFWKKGFVPY